ncbi:MAG: amidohydrolase family protein, partial [Anaerolineae bacterium]|nr:amidohydrolase family protein [Anaerolineae bacterium]
ERWFGLLYANPCARLATVDDLLSSMNRAGISQSVIFGFAFADLGLCRAGNDYVIQAAQAHPDRLIAFAQVNPAVGRAALGEARRCLEAGASGLGELVPDGQGFSLEDRATLDPLMDLAQALDVPISLHVNELVGHSYPGKGSQGLQEVYHLAKRSPHNRLILAHWGGGLPFFELMPEVRSTLRHVYYDTSASLYLYDDAVFRHVAGWAGDKILFGSDYPLIEQKRFLRRIQNAQVEPAALAKLLGLNILHVLAPESTASL